MVWLIALAAAIALADGSIVTLALPQLLGELGTSVEGVAAVLGVYCVTVAVALPLAARAREGWGARRIGVAGSLLLAAASTGCALAASLPVLLMMRALQGVGAAGLLLFAFEVLSGADAGRPSRRWLWTATAVIGTAAGPALGGLLTQAFGWRAIFIAQAPIAFAAAIACWRTRPIPGADLTPALTAQHERQPGGRVATIALALTAAALSAVLFLLVLLLVSGWGFSPLHAAVAMTLVPLGALAVVRLRGPAQIRAAAGCALLGAGVLTLAFIPSPSGWWLVAPLLTAGCGMGLALPALAGELLHERTVRQAGRLLALRHAAIALTLLALAPLIAGQLESATNQGRLQGVAALLDSSLSPVQKIKLAPSIAGAVDNGDPRAALAHEVAADGKTVGSADRAALEKIQHQGDAIIVEIAEDSLRAAFAIAGLLGLLAAAILRAPRRLLAAGVAAASLLLMPAGYAIARQAMPPATPQVSAPCRAGPTPSAGGITGLLQKGVYAGLNRLACSEGIPREQLVLQLTGKS